jgi:hypothetical protein
MVLKNPYTKCVDELQRMCTGGSTRNLCTLIRRGSEIGGSEARWFDERF